MSAPPDASPDAAPDAAPPPGAPPSIQIMECRLDALDRRQCVEFITRQGRPSRVAYLNAHTSNLAARDSAYRRILNACDLVYADGQSIVWASRLLGRRGAPERVTAGDFLEAFLRRCAEKDLNLYLLGGEPGLAEEAADAWRRIEPTLRVCGTRDGFFSQDEEAAVSESIRATRPDIVLAGMGSPRQEAWMDRWADSLDGATVWCVGALFEYYSGRRRRAPVWMRRVGLEWAFRLALEPGRLWRRYLFGNLVFVLRVARRIGRLSE